MSDHRKSCSLSCPNTTYVQP